MSIFPQFQDRESIRRKGLFVAVFLLFTSLALAKANELGSDPVPFWKSKKKLYARIKDQRAIIVSVKQKDLKDSKFKHRLTMKGAVHINVPRASVFATLTRYNQLKDLSEYIVETRWNPQTQVLLMVCEAFQYKAVMHLSLRSQSSLGAASSQITFRVVRGAMKGLNGVIHLKDVERRKTEMSIDAKSDYNQIKLPELFLEWGLEVVLQKIAGRIRSYTESQKGRESDHAGKG